jgi:di/tricarboxylate transporter
MLFVWFLFHLYHKFKSVLPQVNMSVIFLLITVFIFNKNNAVTANSVVQASRQYK